MSDFEFGCSGGFPETCAGCPNHKQLRAEQVHTIDMSPDEHREHHEFVRELVEEMRARKHLRQKILEQVGGWAVISALGALGTAVWHYLQSYLRHN